MPARKDAQPKDIFHICNLQEEFGFPGQNNDIHLLDMERAISDMKKDQVLQQYQYFAGRSRNLLAENEDGRGRGVLMKCLKRCMKMKEQFG